MTDEEEILVNHLNMNSNQSNLNNDEDEIRMILIEKSKLNTLSPTEQEYLNKINKIHNPLVVGSSLSFSGFDNANFKSDNIDLDLNEGEIALSGINSGQNNNLEDNGLVGDLNDDNLDNLEDENVENQTEDMSS